MWKLVSTFCNTAAVRSKPMPVSMFLLGSGRRLPGGGPTRWNCVKTRFQNLDLAEIGVVVDLAARAANAVWALAGGVGGPEVLVLAQPSHALRRQADLAGPDGGCFVVVEVDGCREPLGGQA